MAANYWDSTQANYWTYTRSELSDVRDEARKNSLPLHNKYHLPDRRLLGIFFQQNLVKLARRLSLRQQPLATAQIYIKRFYLKVEIRKTNPYLIMTTAAYLACKMEECPQHIRLVLAEAQRLWPELGVSETSKIGECEFALISTLSSRLILHHPYRSLHEFAPLFSLSPDELHLAQGIVNDSYNTDLALLHPPHILALVAVLLAVVLRPTGGNGGQPLGLQNYSASGPNSPSPGSAGGSGSSPSEGPAMSAAAAQGSALVGLKQSGPKLSRLVEWLVQSDVDMGMIVDATQEMVSLYEAWESYNERSCKDAIAKFMAWSGGL